MEEAGLMAEMCGRVSILAKEKGYWVLVLLAMELVMYLKTRIICRVIKFIFLISGLNKSKRNRSVFGCKKVLLKTDYRRWSSV